MHSQGPGALRLDPHSADLQLDSDALAYATTEATCAACGHTHIIWPR